jgi:hypothetical protein
VDFGPMTIPSGQSRWILRSAQPAIRAGADDPRLIAVCVYALTVEAAAPDPSR